jgi:hypothetical protein
MRDLYAKAYRCAYHHGTTTPQGVQLSGVIHVHYRTPGGLSDLMSEMRRQTPTASVNMATAHISGKGYIAVIIFNDCVMELPPAVHKSSGSRRFSRKETELNKNTENGGLT